MTAVVQGSTSAQEVYHYLLKCPGVMGEAYTEDDRLHDCKVLASFSGRRPEYVVDGAPCHKLLDANYVQI